MDLKLIVLVVVLSAAMYPQSDAWFFRFRRIVQGVKKVWTPLCSLTCPRGCSALTGAINTGQGCRFLCMRVCGRKRRDVLDEDTHVTLLPRNFDFYDLNDDGFVAKNEFAVTFGHPLEEVGLSQAFNLTDIDQDGRLTEEELFLSEVFVFAPVPKP